MAGPGCPPPPSRQGRGGVQEATRRVGAAAGPLLPRRSQSPGSTPPPPPPGLTVPAPRSPPPPPRRSRVTPTGRGKRSQPLALDETPTWLPPSPLLPLPLTPTPPPSPSFSRLGTDCAAAIPKGALLGPARRSAPCALRRGWQPPGHVRVMPDPESPPPGEPRGRAGRSRRRATLGLPARGRTGAKYSLNDESLTLPYLLPALDRIELAQMVLMKQKREF
ncbi:uncharacterized protein LOC143661093 [Tamandua tetradactyla]|uniref:uncharacterized protein LOC143661093 n=1 Tax=Tamandua tetradactyla TaxID=48850 RepID=UPI004054633E